MANKPEPMTYALQVGNPTRSRTACSRTRASSSARWPRLNRPDALRSASSTSWCAASSSATSSAERSGLAIPRSAWASSARAASSCALADAGSRPSISRRACSSPTADCSRTNSSASSWARSDGTKSTEPGLAMASSNTWMGRVSMADSCCRPRSMRSRSLRSCVMSAVTSSRRAAISSSVMSSCVAPASRPARAASKRVARSSTAALARSSRKAAC